MPPVGDQGVPLGLGRKAVRPEPAHSSIACVVTGLNDFFSSSSE